MSAVFSAVGGVLVRTGEQALGYGVGAALGAALAPEVQALLNNVWPTAPIVPLSPQEAATAVVQGALGHADAAAEAAKYGIGAPAFDVLVEINGSPPGPQDLLSMMDRGIVTEAQVRHGLLQSRLKPEWVDAVIAANPALLTIDQLAEMVVQGVLTQPAAEPLAAALSYSPEQFARLVLLAGSPPGPETMIELWNRGDVTEDDVNRALLQSRLKPEWLAAYKRLRYRPVSASIAANALVRERITEAEAVAIAGANGLDPKAFLLWADSIGRPIAVGEALTLVNRGEMTKAQFREAVARSDIRTEYTDQLLKLGVHYPSLLQVEKALQGGIVTDAVARDTLQKEGYPPEWVDAIIASGHATKTAAHKHLALSIVETLHDAGLEDEKTTLAAIEALGYDEAEARELLMLHEARQLVAALVQATGVVRARYVAHQLDELAARAALDLLGLESSTKERLLTTWTAERGANVRTLTPAQIGQALKYQILTQDEAIARWVALGYSVADADVLAGIVEKGPLHPPGSAG